MRPRAGVHARRLVVTSVLATAIRAGVLLVMVELAGTHALGRVFEHVRAPWIAVVAVAELLTYPSYVVAYRSITRHDRRAPLALPLVSRLVVAGFGPFALSGGFSVDRELLQAIDADERGARARVSALGVMEWAVLGPLTCVASTILLIDGAAVSPSLLWPWILGVPAGVAVSAWATGSVRVQTAVRGGGRRLARLGRLLDGVGAALSMARRPRPYVGAWLGLGLYWVAEIGAFLAALRTFGLDLGLGEVILAYATGSIATRRSLPLGGAGLTEILLTYALHELGEPLAPAVAAVLVYRVFNFMLIAVPAVLAYRGLRSRHA